MGCRECGEDNGWLYLDCLCSNCKRKKRVTIIPVIIIVSVLVSLIGAIYAHYDFQYEIDKCNNLKQSNYEFTHDVQVNVAYAEKCFYYQNHPFAYISNVAVIPLLILINLIGIGILFYWYWEASL